MAGSLSANTDREVVQAACALHQVGSIDEAVALLRGAVRRDPSQMASHSLLKELENGDAPSAMGRSVELDFELVDRWIRNGMLVEALALLGGTALGSGDMGQEWANLLGELMAPVPVDAEETLVQMHRQLMSGGASVALTLLEERDRRAPMLPAWAVRRLEVLRWMLLDNARTQETTEVVVPTTELAGVLARALKHRGLTAGRAALAEFTAAHPDDRDAARALAAIETLDEDITRHVHLSQGSSNTMPMVGHVAAAMQLRMGNLDNAKAIYANMIEEEDDERAKVMVSEVEILIAALAGEPLVEDELAGEATQMRAAQPEIPMTTETRLPEESGPVIVTQVGVPELDGPTAQFPAVDRGAEELAAAGRLAEAEEIYRALAELEPHRGELGARADELRARRIAGGATSGVLVRVILPVK